MDSKKLIDEEELELLINEEAYEDASGDYNDDDGDTAVAGPEGGDVLGSLDVPKNSESQGYDVDDILDKIGRSGMSSLTSDELQFLRDQSKS